MYQAKYDGRSRFHFFTPDLNRQAHARLSLEQSLHKAVAREEFELHYQPQVETASGRLIGFEALLRWRRDGKIVSPDQFIKALEDTGLIVPVGSWVLRQACLQLRDWRDACGCSGLSVSVNLSARQFQHGDLVGDVREALTAARLPADALELEITESTLIESVQGSRVAGELQTVGVRLAIDDFGTGYSSLAYLKRFHVDRVKIDRRFVNDIVSDPDDAAIVRAVVSLCRELGIETLAEGVENERQRGMLLEMGCAAAQGYLFGRPVPEQDVHFQRALCGRREVTPRAGAAPGRQEHRAAAK